MSQEVRNFGWTQRIDVDELQELLAEKGYTKGYIKLTYSGDCCENSEVILYGEKED